MYKKKNNYELIHSNFKNLRIFKIFLKKRWSEID